MEIRDSQYLTGLLREFKQEKVIKNDFFVDNLHSVYMQTPKEYILPSLQMDVADRNAVEKYLIEINNYLPIDYSNYSILPNPKPKRDESKLFLVKEFEDAHHLFLNIIKFELKYLGGAKIEEIKKVSTQTSSPSVLTEKIYFENLFFPVDSVQKVQNHIVDFVPKKFGPSLFSKETDIRGKQVYSEIFDDIDYSNIISPIKDKLEIKKHWKLENIFPILKIESQAVSLIFPIFCIPFQDRFFPEIIKAIYEERSPNTKELIDFSTFLANFTFERNLTRSGNIAWKIICL